MTVPGDTRSRKPKGFRAPTGGSVLNDLPGALVGHPGVVPGTVPRDGTAGPRPARTVEEPAELPRSRFLALLTHEMRTPLSAILGYAHLLADGIPEPIPEKAVEQVRRIVACASHLTAVIDQVMAYSRLEGGENGVHVAPVDVADLVSEVMAIVQPLADRKGLLVRTRLDAAPSAVESDAGRLRQILLNLLGNAVKFTDDGEVTLIVHRSAEHLMFHVRDCGPGVDPEEQALIFEPFVQGRASTEQTRGGTGLGLAICRMFARSLDGDVVVASIPGKGSTFTLWIPDGAASPA